MATSDEKVALPFSEKYDDEHALHYLNKHQETLASRISHWRDVQMARRALAAAGNPASVLDLPCGAGRFWPLLAEKQDRTILAADNSQSMIEVAAKAQDPAIVKKIKTFQTSAFEIDLPADAVETIFCMRLIHHIGNPEHRAKMLKEFHRVAKDSVIISLWVDGNYKAWRRQSLEKKRIAQGKKMKFQNRFIIPVSQIEQEFNDAGFDVVSHQDFLPFFAMWRVYVLKKSPAARSGRNA